jgi:hypothetical protein
MSPELESSAAGSSPPEAASPPDVNAAAAAFARRCAGEEPGEAGGPHKQEFGWETIAALVPADLPKTVLEGSFVGFKAGAKFVADHYKIPLPF